MNLPKGHYLPDISTNKMIQRFITYIKEQMNNQSCIYEIHENKTYVHSMYVDFDNDFNLGRMTLWEDNSCVMEILNIETGNSLFSERYEFTLFDELLKEYQKFYSILSQSIILNKSNIANK